MRKGEEGRGEMGKKVPSGGEGGRRGKVRWEGRCQAVDKEMRIHARVERRERKGGKWELREGEQESRKKSIRNTYNTQLHAHSTYTFHHIFMTEYVHTSDNTVHQS